MLLIICGTDYINPAQTCTSIKLLCNIKPKPKLWLMQLFFILVITISESGQPFSHFKELSALLKSSLLASKMVSQILQPQPISAAKV